MTTSITDQAMAFYAAAAQYYADAGGGAASTDITSTHTADNTVTNASETLLAANDNRKGCLIQNTHASENVRVRLDGGVATTTNGIQIRPGGLLSLSTPNCPKTAITGIREGSADVTVHVVELT